MFTVGGLPAHPLLVHAVVVLIPLAALGAIAVAVRPRWNRPYAPLVAFGALAAAVAATLSKLAGEQLLGAINVSPEYAVLLGEHGRWGLFTTISSWIFAAFTVATAMLGRGRDGNLRRVVGALSAVVGIVSLALVMLAGHTGSTSVWSSVVGG